MASEFETYLRSLIATDPEAAADFRARLAAAAAVQQTSMAGAFRRAVDALPDESKTALAQLLGASGPVPAGASATTRARLRLVSSAGQEGKG